MQNKVARYSKLGVVAGTAIGTFCGIVIAGPHLHDWSSKLLLSVVAGIAMLGASIGYFAVYFIAGSLIRGESGSGGGTYSSDEGRLYSLNAVTHEHHHANDAVSDNGSDY